VPPLPEEVSPMADHDPLCPKHGLHPADEAMMAIVVECQCDLIARVRADEREKVLTEGASIARGMVAQAVREERERLFAQVEALLDGHRLDSTTWDTGVPKCRHRDHRSGWSASCPQAWAAHHLMPLLGGESDAQ